MSAEALVRTIEVDAVRVALTLIANVGCARDAHPGLARVPNRTAVTIATIVAIHNGRIETDTCRRVALEDSADIVAGRADDFATREGNAAAANTVKGAVAEVTIVELGTIFGTFAFAGFGLTAAHTVAASIVGRAGVAIVTSWSRKGIEDATILIITGIEGAGVLIITGQLTAAEAVAILTKGLQRTGVSVVARSTILHVPRHAGSLSGVA